MSPKRSRSRSPHRDDRKKYKKRHSHDRSPGSRREDASSTSSRRGSSRSASPSEKHRRRTSYKTSRREQRSRSYTPVTNLRESKDRDDPNVCHCLGVFGLSSYTHEKELRDVFAQYGDIDDICIIYDRHSGHSKGYGFVYFKSTSDAIEARRNTQGLVLDRRPIRVDYSLTVRPHSPTPGRYLGRRTNRDFDRRYNDGGDYDDRVSYRDNRRYSSRDWH